MRGPRRYSFWFPGLPQGLRGLATLKEVAASLTPLNPGSF